MSTYELQLHARYLFTNAPTLYARHTGYDLIERDNNGNIVKITSIDLSPSSAMSKSTVLVMSDSFLSDTMNA